MKLVSILTTFAIAIPFAAAANCKTDYGYCGKTLLRVGMHSPISSRLLSTQLTCTIYPSL